MQRGACVEEIKTEKPLLWSKNGIFKLLGIKYELHVYQNDIYKQNFTEKNNCNKKKKLLNDWSLRNFVTYWKSYSDKKFKLLPFQFSCSHLPAYKIYLKMV